MQTSTFELCFFLVFLQTGLNKTKQKERGVIGAPNQKSRNGTDIKQNYIQGQKYVTDLSRFSPTP